MTANKKGQIWFAFIFLGIVIGAAYLAAKAWESCENSEELKELESLLNDLKNGKKPGFL